MEQALGFGFTGDENWRPLKFPLVFWTIAGVLLLFSVLVLLWSFLPKNHSKNVTK
jgi:hypothetical protein